MMVNECPYCGGVDLNIQMFTIDTGMGPDRKYGVHCMGCHGQGPWAITSDHAAYLWANRPDRRAEEVPPGRPIRALIYVQDETQPNPAELPPIGISPDDFNRRAIAEITAKHLRK
jgi:hypothetical protein